MVGMTVSRYVHICFEGLWVQGLCSRFGMG
jgi:hypothetical protein